MRRRSVRIGVHGALAVLLVGLFVQSSAGEEETSNSSSGAVGTTLVDSFSLTKRQDPIHIRSRDLEFLYDKKRIQYNGDVVVTQGDITLKTDRLTVTYEDVATKHASLSANTNSSSRQRLKEIVAEGNVEITSQDRRATSEKAVFNEDNRTVTLTGNAVVRDGSNQVTGEIVTVFLDEKRSVVEGGADRQVNFIIYPEQ